MAHTLDTTPSNSNDYENSVRLEADEAGNINIPEGNFVGDAELSREGQDLTLEFSNGDSFAVENYFSDQNDFLIQDSAGGVLTEDLANSFVQSSPEYAQNASMTDESPVGAVEEIKGSATVTHADGSTNELTLGSPIHQGDVIETSGDGAVNIVFIDETSMAISEGARIAVDNYKFDPTTESGETDLSVLRGVFVYTSGLIGRDDPDDVEINTPVGSIGIRGTIIAGNINPEGQSEITVLEGAIVVKNGDGERTLSQQYETVKLSGFQDAIEYKGVEAANDIGKTYGSVSDVLPKLFSSINDAAQEEVKTQQEAEQEAEEEIKTQEEETKETPAEGQENQEQETILSPDPTLEIAQEGAEFAADQGEEIQVVSQQDIAEKSALSKNSTTAKAEITQVQNEAPTHLYQDTKEIREENFEVLHAPEPLLEYSKAGTVINVVTLKNYPTGTDLIFDSGTNTSASGNYQITRISGTNKFEIKLVNNIGTGVGAGIEAAGLVISLPNGATTSLPTFDPTIQDAAVHLNAAGGLNYDVSAGVAPTDSIKVKDFDGDGDEDFARINATGDVVISDTEAGTPFFTLSNHNYTSIDVIGDINNDGYTDIVAGTEGFNSNAGKAAVILGGTNPGAPTINYDAFSSTAGDLLGHSITAVGDLNAGTENDFVVGATGANSGNGRLILQYGTTGHSIIDGTSGEELGQDVYGLGDVNGDGLGDFMATTALNSAYVIFGQLSSISNFDTSEFSSTGTSNGFKIDAGMPMVAAGAAGDINGDGFDDFAISLDDGTDINTYVVYGNGTSANLDLSYLENPENALKINHAGASGTNYQITAVGDVDGDGFDDIQVGNSAGQFVVHGDIGGNNVPYAADGTATDGDSNDGIVRATAHNQSLVGDVDFNDANFNNLRMSGGGSNNTFEINNNDFARIDGGNGFDTISFVTGGASLDFSNILPEQINGIEAINFGSTSQTIRLTAENIFNMFKSSDDGNLVISGGGTIEFNVDDPGAITHDPTAVLNSQSSGTAGYSTTVLGDGNTYNTYTVGGYNLYIEQDPATTFTFV